MTDNRETARKGDSAVFIPIAKESSYFCWVRPRPPQASLEVGTFWDSAGPASLSLAPKPRMGKISMGGWGQGGFG